MRLGARGAGWSGGGSAPVTIDAVMKGAYIPYDSTYTAYSSYYASIDTGVQTTNQQVVECDIMFRDAELHATIIKLLFSAYDATTGTGRFVGVGSTNRRFICRSNSRNAQLNVSTTSLSGIPIRCRMVPTGFIATRLDTNVAIGSFSLDTYEWTAFGTWCLFGNPATLGQSSGTGGPYSAIETEIRRFKVYESEAQDARLLCDVIPVRVGSVGYMYDQVSGRLLASDDAYTRSDSARLPLLYVPDDTQEVCHVISKTPHGFFADDSFQVDFTSETIENIEPFSLQLTSSNVNALGPDWNVPAFYGSLTVGGRGAIANDSVEIGLQDLNFAGGWYTVCTAAGNFHTLALQPSGTTYIDGIIGTVASSGGDGGCLGGDTRVTLADGSEKRIRDIGYDDELLVWDHGSASFSRARPSWVMRPYVADGWFLCRFRSGREVVTCGAPGDPGHRFFNLDIGRYEYERDCIGHRVRVVRVTGKVGSPAKIEIAEDVLMSVERVPHPCEAFNVITQDHYNLFAEGVLASCRLSNGGLSPDEEATYWARLEKARLPR